MTTPNITPIRKTNKWDCLLTSFAMASGISERSLRKLIGHDGSQVWRPDLPEPARRVGFHPQEIITALLQEGVVVSTHTPKPTSMLHGTAWPIDFKEDAMQFLMERLMTGPTVVTLQPKSRSTGHAVAIANNTVYDPDTGIGWPIEIYLQTLAPKHGQLRDFHLVHRCK